MYARGASGKRPHLVCVFLFIGPSKHKILDIVQYLLIYADGILLYLMERTPPLHTRKASELDWLFHLCDVYYLHFAGYVLRHRFIPSLKHGINR